jgi:hypothetical protein
MHDHGSTRNFVAPPRVDEKQFTAMLGGTTAAPKVSLRGVVTIPNSGAVLKPFVEAVHGQLTTVGVSAVDVDLKELEFCNSSGFKSLIHWATLVTKLPGDSQYRLRFHTNPNRRWQRTSLLALSCFAINITEIL